MTAFNYNRSKTTADRLIARFGQTGALRVPTKAGTAYNPEDGSPDDQTARFVVTDYSTSEIDGTRVLATDKKVYLAKGTLTVEPTPAHLLVEADDSVYKIVAVQPLKPATTTVCYELQVRR